MSESATTTATATATSTVAALLINDNDDQHNNEISSLSSEFKRLTILGRLLLFFALPTSLGLFGSILAFFDPENKDKKQKIDFDKDFLFPFVMGVVVVIAVGFQTRGYRKSPEPLISWPKKVVKKKIVHKYVDENGNEVDAPTTDDVDFDSKKNN